MSDAPWRDKDTLQRLLNEGFSQQAIADELGCSRTTVDRWIDRLDIEEEDIIEEEEEYRHHHRAWTDRDVLTHFYIDEGLSLAETGKKLDCGPATIRNWLKRFGISTR